MSRAGGSVGGVCWVGLAVFQEVNVSKVTSYLPGFFLIAPYSLSNT